MKFNDGLEILGVDDTGSGVFRESAVEDVQLPHTLKRIERDVFYDCKNLRSITLPDSLEYIGDGCFSESGLEEVQIPKEGVQAEDDAFDDCPAKDTVVFRDGKVFPKDQ